MCKKQFISQFSKLIEQIVKHIIELATTQFFAKIITITMIDEDLRALLII